MSRRGTGLKYNMDAVPGPPALLVHDVITFRHLLTASPCPAVHVIRGRLLEDVKSKLENA